MSHTAAERPGAFTRLLQRIVEVKPEEVKALFVACAYFFFVLTSYYIIRPIRDEMGLAGGVENLPWLFTGTLIVMVAVQPLFGAIVARYPRRQFIPYAYRFFILNLIAFFALLKLQPEMGIWTGRVFFIWAAVFNLFVVSVFWAFMADLFRNEQGKRLFGFVGVGGTLGAVSGAAITAFLAEIIGPINLLLASALCLEIGVQCVQWLGRVAARRDAEPEAAGSPSRAEPDHGPPQEPSPSAAARAADAPRTGGATSPVAKRSAETDPDSVIGGSIISGLTHVFRSPYLLGVCAYMLLYTIGSTFLYFQQAEIIEAHFVDRAARTAFFAKIDLTVNALTLFTQAYLTGRMMKWLGVGLTLGLLPAISVIGFGVVGLAPGLITVIGFQVLRRASNYAVSRPSREVLFTVVPREDKYKAKSFIDTFVYRLGDQVGAWSYALLGAVGLGIAGISVVAVPLSALWLGISLWLGRRQQRMAQEREGGPVVVADVAPAGAR